MQGIIAHGKVGQDAALIWFLWWPLNWRFWRWPQVERMGQFGRYTYRWRIGPFDGKWRPAYPQHFRIYDTWMSYRLEIGVWRWHIQFDFWYKRCRRITARVWRQRRIELDPR